MKTSTVVWVIIVLLIIIGAGWYFYSTNPTMAPATTTNTTTPPATGGTTASPIVLQTGASGTLGTFLVDAQNGMTLYSYSPDTPGVSNCTGQCAVNWPPYIVNVANPLTAAAGITGALGTTVRADGSTQLTYNGTPLYTYIKDAKPGDTVGQGVGGIWYVVHP